MPVNGLKKLAKDLQTFDLEYEQFEILRDHREDMADLQAQQMAEGKDNTGRVRNDDYSPLTARYKREFGQGLGRVIDRVTFYMTGQMYRDLWTYFTKSTYMIKARTLTERWDKMYERVGKDRYGYDEQRKQTVRDEIVTPNVRKVLFEKTGLKF